MQFTGYSFGSIRVDGVTYGHDLIIDRGKVRKRKKATSQKFRAAYGHTQLSAEEDIPWRCRRLVIGPGAAGALPGTVADALTDARFCRNESVADAHTYALTGILYSWFS